MNKLSSCELFQMVDKSFKGSLIKTLQEVSQNIDKYLIEMNMYDFIVKSMRSYKYPLSKMVVSATLKGEIRPLLLADPKDPKDKQIYLPSAIPSFSTMDGKHGFVDISPRAGYDRNKLKLPENLKVKEVELYTYLNMAFIDAYTKRHSGLIDRSNVIGKNTAIAYSRLFSRCIDRTYPISAKPEKFNISIFLSSVFCLVQFFNYKIEDAINFTFSTGISKRTDIESDCKVLREGKMDFNNLSSFIDIYSYEFEEYIKKNSLNIRTLVNLYQKMYGANSWFALEHGTTFLNMILCVPIGLYNDKFISKTIKAQVDDLNKGFVTIFANVL